MSQLQLYAINKAGPTPLPPLPGAQELNDLYIGLALGVYSVVRTFEHNKFLYLEHHLARTVQSMTRLGWDYQLDEASLRRALHVLCTAAPFAETRVRIDVLAAPALSLGTESRLLVALAPFYPLPAAYYSNGVNVGFAKGLARPNPLVKAAQFSATRRGYDVGSVETYERLMVNEQGEILEGISSNFYGVRGGVLQTAQTGVLEGITRRILLELAAGLAIPVRLAALHVDEIHMLDEAAISSSSRGLLPVVRIAGQPIGDGRPGPVCRSLMAAYDQFVARTIRHAVVAP